MASRDYEEFIAEFNAHGVRYVVVGAHAVAAHARPRATKDLDVLIDPTASNARRVLAALKDFFGGVDLGYQVKDFTDPKWIVQLGVAPVRIDILAGIPGCRSFRGVWSRRYHGRFGRVPANYLSLEDLVRAKQAIGRPQDLADIESLRRAQAAASRRSHRRSN
jgi:hypothetical protein